MNEEKKPNPPRVPISTAITPDEYDRLAILKSNGWSTVGVFRLGLTTAEKKLNKKS